MEKLIRNKPSKIIIFFVICFVALSSHLKHQEHKTSIISSDVVSYYGYLPATFIHGDLSLSFVDEDPGYYGSHGMFWPETAENGGKVIKTTMGLSYLYAPFFLVAHAYTSAFTQHEANGFTEPYRVSVMVACIVYLLLGLLFIRKTLLLWFSEWTAAFVIIFLVLGTNIYHYSTIEPGMSHVFTFSVSAAYIYYTIRWHRSQQFKHAIYIGLFMGVLTLIRPVNILMALFFILYGLQNIRQQIQLFWKHRKHIIFIMLIAFLVMVPQFIYWKYNTGQWMYNSYGDEGFFFGQPHILEGFLSYRKGWFVYTPLMLLAVIAAGIFAFKKRTQSYFWVVFFPLYTYVVFSWWAWWYGGSFGMRAMIDIYAFFAIPLGYIFYQSFQKSKIITAILFIVSYAGIQLNQFQSEQYMYGGIHYDSMTKKAYWTNFGKMKPTGNFYGEIQQPDYDKAVEGKEDQKIELFLFD